MTISLNREGTLKNSNNEHIYEFHAIGMCVGTLALEFGIEARNHTSDVMLVIRPHKFQLYEMFGWSQLSEHVSLFYNYIVMVSFICAEKTWHK